MRVLVLFAAMSIISPIYARNTVALDTGWLFHTDPDNSGTDRGWHLPDFDDSDWRPIEVGRNYEAQGITYDGYSWYRLHFTVPKNWRADDTLLLRFGAIDDADVTYLNGTVIGRTGPMGDEQITMWTQPRLYFLPPGTIQPGRENVLAVRVWDQRGGGGLYKEPIDLSRIADATDAVTKVARLDTGVELQLSSGARVRLLFYAPGIIRVRAVPSGKFRRWLAHDLMLHTDPPGAITFQFDRANDHINLKTSRLHVRIATDPLNITYLAPDGRLLTSQNPGFWWGNTLRGEALSCKPDEHFLGLGEYGPHIDRRGHRQRLWVIHSYQAEDIPVPFFLSSAGYGIFWCNSFDGFISLAASAPETLLMAAEGGETDYFVIAGDDPKDIIKGYVDLTGHSPLPPRWAFGYWQSRAGWGTDRWARETVTRLRNDGFPIDVLHMDGWANGIRMRFSPQRFPDPQALIDWLKDRGVKLCLWETPFVGPHSPRFEEGIKRYYFAKNPDGHFYPVSTWVGDTLGLIDFLNPDACKWRQSQHLEELAMGVGAFKTDGGDTREVPADAVFHGGHTGHEVHNLYPLLFNRCIYNGQQKARPAQRVINWTRTGYAGIQRYPCTWGGDQASTFGGTRVLVRAGINAGICGIAYWSQDLGGFGPGARTKEFYVRSCQWGFLSPLSRVHGNASNADPSIVGNEPWVFGQQAENIVRKYARLRYRLLPYIYSYAVTAWRTGAPIMRALPLEFPDDAATYACDYQYMLGREIMVAPIVQPSDRDDLAATRQVYLPAGKWYDFWTDETWTGPRHITCTAPFDTLPVFVRAGAIVPFGPDIDYIEGPPTPQLTIDVYAGSDGAFDLIEDDGVTLRYRDGEIAVTQIAHTERAGTCEIALSEPVGTYDGMPKSRPITFRLHGLKAKPSAHVNAEPASVRWLDDHDIAAVGPVQVTGPATVKFSKAE